ncbi:MAG: hypothetical protein IT233_00710 [Bacteroidia bacterium]|nr:hypothetical protein [Bacteroidia bacterium]
MKTIIIALLLFIINAKAFSQKTYQENNYLREDLVFDPTLVFPETSKFSYNDSLSDVKILNYWTTPLQQRTIYLTYEGGCSYVFRICYNEKDYIEDMFHVTFDSLRKHVEFYTQTRLDGRVGTACDRRIASAKYNFSEDRIIVYLLIKDGNNESCKEQTYVELFMKIEFPKNCK